MAGQPAVEVTGAKELRAALGKMGHDLDDLKATHLAAAKVVADEARGRAPVLTGRLAGSVKPHATKTKAYVQAGGKRLPYAPPIHFGWPKHNIAPQPFLFDALDKRRSEVVDLYQKRVGDLVERVGRETP